MIPISACCMRAPVGGPNQRLYKSGTESISGSRDRRPDGIGQLLRRCFVETLKHQNLIAADLDRNQAFIGHPSRGRRVADSRRNPLREFVSPEQRIAILRGKTFGGIRL